MIKELQQLLEELPKDRDLVLSDQDKETGGCSMCKRSLQSCDCSGFNECLNAVRLLINKKICQKRNK